MYSGEYDWASIPKVVSSNPTVVRHIFQACPVWIYTQSNITSIIYSTVDISVTVVIYLLYYLYFLSCVTLF